MKREVYIVFYSTGSYEDFCENIAGVFDNKEFAIKCSKELDEKWEENTKISEQIQQARDELFDEIELKYLALDKQKENLLDELESKYQNKKSQEYLLGKEEIESKMDHLYEEVEKSIEVSIMEKLGITESVFYEAKKFDIYDEYNGSHVEPYELKS